MSDPVTPDPAQVDVAELRALLGCATPQPWLAEEGEIWRTDYDGQPHLVARRTSEEDAAFIAAARNALPALLDRLEAAMAVAADAWDEGHRHACEYDDNLCNPINPYREPTA